jgi:hypothetical protein
MAGALQILSYEPVESRGLILRFLGNQDDPALRKLCSSDPWLAYFYAVDVLGGRFPEGEMVIARNGAVAIKYAKDILKGRFVEAEGEISEEGGDDSYMEMLKVVNPQQYVTFMEEHYGWEKEDGGAQEA